MFNNKSTLTGRQRSGSDVSQRKIFIGGLAYGATDNTLTAYFSKYGDITDAVVMRDTITKKSRGFGFITFASSSSVDLVLGHTNGVKNDKCFSHTIDNRKIEIKRAIPKHDINANPNHYHFQSTDGKTIHSDRPAHAPKALYGMGVCNTTHDVAGEYTVHNKAQTGLELQLLGDLLNLDTSSNLSTMHNTPCVCQEHTNSSVRTNNLMSPNENNMLHTLAYIPEGELLDNDVDATHAANGTSSCGYKLFVGGLHYETRNHDLYTYFNNFGDVRVAEVMFHRGTQNPRGFGFVTFAKEEEAQSVLRREMNVINGKKVEVKWAVPVEAENPTKKDKNSGIRSTPHVGGSLRMPCEDYKHAVASHGKILVERDQDDKSIGGRSGGCRSRSNSLYDDAIPEETNAAVLSLIRSNTWTDGSFPDRAINQQQHSIFNQRTPAHVHAYQTPPRIDRSCGARSVSIDSGEALYSEHKQDASRGILPWLHEHITSSLPPSNPATPQSMGMHNPQSVGMSPQSMGMHNPQSVGMSPQSMGMYNPQSVGMSPQSMGMHNPQSVGMSPQSMGMHTPQSVGMSPQSMGMHNPQSMMFPMMHPPSMPVPLAQALQGGGNHVYEHQSYMHAAPNTHLNPMEMLLDDNSSRSSFGSMNMQKDAVLTVPNSLASSVSSTYGGSNCNGIGFGFGFGLSGLMEGVTITQQ